MYFSIRVKCTPSMKFSVPHKDKPMKFSTLAKEFPKFVELFDGQSIENTMAFYWKKDKNTGIYEFIDSDAEDEVAELMGVQLIDTTIDEEEKPTENRQLTTEEIAEFKNELNYIKSQLEGTTIGFRNNIKIDQEKME